MKDLFLVLGLSITVTFAGFLKSESNNLLPKEPVNTQKYISYLK